MDRQGLARQGHGEGHQVEKQDMQKKHKYVKQDDVIRIL